MNKVLLLVMLSITTLFTHVSCSSGDKIPLSEREALQKIFKSLHGEEWKKADGWNGEHGTEGKWFGVTVTTVKGRQHVTELHLIHNKALGTISDELVGLPYLRVLETDSSLTLSEKTAKSLKNLETLICRDLPDTVGYIENLQYISVTYTTVYSSITRLKKLKILEMFDSRLETPELFSELFRIQSLQRLTLRTMYLDQTIPKTIGSAVNLEVIDIRDSLLQGEIPKEIGNLTQLKVLDVAGNKLVGTLPSEIQKCVNLTDINICDTSITIKNTTLENLPDSITIYADTGSGIQGIKKKNKTIVVNQYPLYHTILVEGARLRKSPDLNAEILASLKLGNIVKNMNVISPNTSEVTINNRHLTAKWYQVSTLDGKVGWVWSGLVSTFPRSSWVIEQGLNNDRWLLEVSEMPVVYADGRKITDRDITIKGVETVKILVKIKNVTKETFIGDLLIRTNDDFPADPLTDSNLVGYFPQEIIVADNVKEYNLSFFIKNYKNDDSFSILFWELEGISEWSQVMASKGAINSIYLKR